MVRQFILNALAKRRYALLVLVLDRHLPSIATSQNYHFP